MSTTPPEQPPSGGYDRPGAGPNVNFNLNALMPTPGNAELVVYILATILIAIIALAADQVDSGAFVDRGARVGLEGKVVQPDAITVVGLRLGLRLAQPDCGPWAAEVPDRLAALALDLADPVEAERAEQLGVESQAALDRGDDQVDVVDAG